MSLHRFSEIAALMSFVFATFGMPAPPSLSWLGLGLVFCVLVWWFV